MGIEQTNITHAKSLLNIKRIISIATKKREKRIVRMVLIFLGGL